MCVCQEYCINGLGYFHSKEFYDWFPLKSSFVCVCWLLTHVLLCNPILGPTRRLYPWNSPGKNIEVDCQALLQGIFSTQASKPGLPHCRQILYCLSYQGSPQSSFQFSSVQSLSRVWLFATPWITARQASLSITNSQSLLKLMSIESVMPSSHPILCRRLLLLPPVPPSIRVSSSESTLPMRWPKYWSFSFSISPSNEHPGLISFRMDWLYLPAVQGTLKSLFSYF